MLLSSLSSVVAIMRVILPSPLPVVEALSVSSMPRHGMIVVVIVIALVAVALAIAVGHVPNAVHSTCLGVPVPPTSCTIVFMRGHERSLIPVDFHVIMNRLDQTHLG